MANTDREVISFDYALEKAPSVFWNLTRLVH